MKNSSILFLFILGIILSACQVDPNDDIQNTELDSKLESIEITTESAGHTDTMRGQDQPPEAILLHKRMAWAAYTATMVLQDNANANVRTHFLDGIASGNNVFSLDDLLGANPSDGGLFKTEFEHEFGIILCGFAINNYGCPVTGGTNPSPPPSGDGNGFQQSEIPTLTQQFINYLIVDNCLDIYFPDGLLIGIGNNNVTSVAHPLNNNPGNWGIKRTGKHDTFPAFVDPNYSGNVVVVRPSDIETPTCDYSSYNLNFANFLN